MELPQINQEEVMHPLLEKNKTDTIYAKIAEKEVEYLNKKRIPFCGRCARIEIKEEIEREQKKEMDRKGFIEWPIIHKKMNELIANLNKYAEPTRFEFIERRDALDTKRGTNVKELTGHIDIFKCKERNCNIQIRKELEETKKK